MERGLNSAVAGNASFQRKLEAYRQSTYQLTFKLTNYADWTETTIAERQLALAKMAKSIWSVPL